MPIPPLFMYSRPVKLSTSRCVAWPPASSYADIRMGSQAEVTSPLISTTATASPTCRTSIVTSGPSISVPPLLLTLLLVTLLLVTLLLVTLLLVILLLVTLLLVTLLLVTLLLVTLLLVTLCY